MECENVFKAARDGNLCEIKYVLNNKSEDEVRSLVSALTDSATPLAIASRNGHLDVVTYLLEECHADVEQDAKIDFEVKGTPLFWAVAFGHLNVVKALIKYKVVVNSITNLDYPLGIACNNDYLEVVEYLIEQGANIDLPDTGDTCLMITCLNGHYKISKYLLECGADVNVKNAEGDTPLHACVRSGNLEIIKLLLQHGAVMNTNGDGLTPLLYAALRSYDATVVYIIKEYNCTKQEIVNALELLGATFVDENQDMVAARNCWKLAIELRYEDSEFPLEKSIYKSPISSYVHATEMRTSDQLNELNGDQMEIQALIIRERILGPCHPISFYFIRNRARIYAENVNFQQCIRLWMYIFDSEIDQDLGMFNYYTLLPFAEIFHEIMSEIRDVARNIPTVSFSDILLVLKCAVGRIETTLNMTQDQENDSIRFHKHCILIIITYLVSLICELQPHLSANEELSLKNTAYKLVHLNPKGRNGFTLLHIASCNDSLLVLSDDIPWLPAFLREFTFPSPEAVDLLLEVGACPNALDSSKNTPLHVASMNRPFDQNVFHLLLDEGAHLDLCNNENQTPLQLVPDAHLLDIYPLHHLNLQCLCAQAINKHNIAYKDLLHENLYEFVDSHGSH